MSNLAPTAPSFPATNYARNGRIMFISIVILFSVVIVILLFHIYIRWYLLRITRGSRRRRVNFSPDDNDLSQGSQSLDPVILKSLPVFIHSSVSDEVLECAVCLSEFQVNEKGRTLPGCKHSFHIDCIDMWFHSHSTCPLCRSTVKFQVPRQVSQSVRVDVPPEPSDVREKVPAAAIASSPSSSSSSRSIRIEVPPRRMEEIGFEVRSPGVGEEFKSPGSGQGFKSPGSRMMSLKRMLSGKSFGFHVGDCSPYEVDLERNGEEGRPPLPPARSSTAEV